MNKNNHPSIHGYRKQDILDWVPKKDEYNEFMRAKVPLQSRNDSFKPIQANPLLDQEVESLTLAGDYNNNFFKCYQYDDEFAKNVFNFWQYLDYHASWHGMVAKCGVGDLYVGNPSWKGKYEFGILNLPNPAYTNAAHKNGVKTLGCIFFPRTEHADDIVYKDENGRFPIADKLVEICNYYGFDGYFVNAEEELPSSFMPLYEEFIRAMTSQGIYVQVYASSKYGQKNKSSWGKINYFNKNASEFSNWVKRLNKQQAASSLYMNPDPSKEMVDGSVSIMNSLDLDARKTVFNTLEAGQTGFSGRRGSLYNTFDENLVPRTAIANLGTEMVWSGLEVSDKPANQKYAFARERIWWSGSLDQPYYSSDKKYVDHPTTDYSDEEREQLLKDILNATTNPYITANNPNRATPKEGLDLEKKPYQPWPGLAAFISERSVIKGGNFYTNFNTGHGMQYYSKGKVVKDNEWVNINIQDILPTWQWWIQTLDKDEKALKVDFDYGKEYSPAFKLYQIGGYNGGSSLVVKGDLVSENFLRLYKTNIDVNKNSKASIVFYKTSKTDESEMKLGLIFKDSLQTVEYISIPSSEIKTNQWETRILELNKYNGRQIVLIGLAFELKKDEIKDYQMNIGEIKITDSTCKKPEIPLNFKIDKAYDNSELYVSWDLEDYSKVQKYNIYAEYADGKEIYLGGTYDDVYYIKTLYNPMDKVKIKLTAVGIDGIESDCAILERDFSKTIKNIKVNENVGYFKTLWELPDVSYSSIKAEVTFDYSHDSKYTQFFEKGTTSSLINIPIIDGSNYTLRLSLLDEKGNVLSYTDYSGKLKDIYSNVYEGKAIFNEGKVKLTAPTSKDWWHLYASQNGNIIKFKDGAGFATRGVDDLTNLQVHGSFGVIEVVLEDYAGNFSAPVKVEFGKNQS